eukprot:scpid48402/ scgid17400/ 
MVYSRKKCTIIGRIRSVVLFVCGKWTKETENTTNSAAAPCFSSLYSLGFFTLHSVAHRHNDIHCVLDTTNRSVVSRVLTAVRYLSMYPLYVPTLRYLSMLPVYVCSTTVYQVGVYSTTVA